MIKFILAPIRRIITVFVRLEAFLAAQEPKPSMTVLNEEPFRVELYAYTNGGIGTFYRRSKEYVESQHNQHVNNPFGPNIKTGWKITAERLPGAKDQKDYRKVPTKDERDKVWRDARWSRDRRNPKYRQAPYQ